MRSQLSFYRRVVYSLTLMLLLGHSMSYGQAKFKFTGVVEGADGKRLPKVTVELEGEKSYKEKTDKLGFFEMKKVLAGDYTIKIKDKDDVLHEESFSLESQTLGYNISIGSPNSNCCPFSNNCHELTEPLASIKTSCVRELQ